MKFSIAIIDDEQEYALKLQEYIRLWVNRNSHSLEIRYFESPEFFLATMAKEHTINMVFLDVYMPNINGIEVSKRLRQIDPKVPIILVSSYPQFSLDGYEANATRFIVKNSANFDEKIHEAMTYALNLFESARSSYVITNSRMTQALHYNEIMYFEAKNHDILIHTKDNSYTERKKLTALLDELPRYFIRCSRSFIVNIQYVAVIRQNNIELENGELIPYSKQFKNDVTTAYLTYK